MRLDKPNSRPNHVLSITIKMKKVNPAANYVKQAINVSLNRSLCCNRICSSVPKAHTGRNQTPSNYVSIVQWANTMKTGSQFQRKLASIARQAGSVEM